MEAGYSGAGKRLRRRVSGKTKTEVQDKLRQLHQEIAAGLVIDRNYRVSQCLDNWFANSCGGVSPSTITKQRYIARYLYDGLGYTKLAELNPSDVERLLSDLSSALSTDTLRQMLRLLQKAIYQAQIDDKIGRNVAALIERVPRGKVGRESKSLTKEQAVRLLRAAKQPVRPSPIHPGLKRQERRPASLMYAYVAVSLLSGIRTEEARALRWDLVDLEAGTIAVWRSDRIGGDTKTPKSRRTLLLAKIVPEALQAWKTDQDQERAAAGQKWAATGLVFTTRTGGHLSATTVRRWFKQICERANLGQGWTPQELRHTFVSLLSENGMLIEEIADLVGHSSTHTTQTVYRKQLRPVLRSGALAMGAIFADQATPTAQEQPAQLDSAQGPEVSGVRP